MIPESFDLAFWIAMAERSADNTFGAAIATAGLIELLQRGGALRLSRRDRT